MSENKKPLPRMGMSGPPSGSGQKAKDVKQTLFRLYQLMESYRLMIGIVLIFAIFSVAFSIIGPKLLGKVTTKLVEGLYAYFLDIDLFTDFNYMGRIIAILIALYVFSALCNYIQRYIMSGVTMDLTYRLRKEASQKIHKLPMDYYHKNSHGDVLSRITNDIDLISQTLNQAMTQLVTSITTIIGVIIMMLTISWLMTLATLLIIPMSLVLIRFIFSRSQGFFKAQQKSIGDLNGQVEEIYGGHNVVQAFNGQEQAKASFKRINDELHKSAWKSQFVSSIMQPIMRFVGNLGYVVVSILGGYLAVKQVIKVGDIQAFIQYVRNFTQPMTQLASISNTLQSTIAACERVFEFLDESEEEETPSKIDPSKDFSGSVTFEHVHFGYEPGKTIINDFSSHVEPGQKIAIVGPTGAGKSTIVKLLMRFYPIDKGNIRIDGHDILDFSRNDLRSLFGMVLQDTWLYNASIMENIRYGTFGASDQDVIDAAKAAHCDEFIKSLPHGYDMVLNEEASNISQGQKQLFTIARVLLADPKILILDEATSSVDTRTELLIQKAMDKLMENRTSFVIAHRLSTIKDADTILVMKDGDIIEQGNHNELLGANGFYADLYNSQFAIDTDD